METGPAVAPAYEPTFAPDLGAPHESRGFTEKLWLLWRRRAFLWRVLWISAVIATIVAFILPPHYKSTVKFVPQETSANSMSNLISRAVAGAPTLGLDAANLLSAKTPGAFYIEVLESRTVQDRLVERFDLRTHYSKKYYQDARKKLDRFTDIEEDRKSGVVTLAVFDWDPKFAAMLANAYIEEMNRLAASLNTSAAHREREFLEARLQSAKQELDQASILLSEFSSKHTMMDVQGQGRAMIDAAARLQGELAAAESELRGLEQIYSADSVKVRTVRARIGELRAQLNKMVGGYADPGIAPTEQEAVGQYPALRTLPALGYRYADLYRNAKIHETIVEILTQQYELARVQEAKELPSVRVMDFANVPEKRNSPIRSLVVGLSVAVAFLLGCVWVVEKDRWERLPMDDSRRLLASEVSADVKAAWSKVKNRRGPPSELRR